MELGFEFQYPWALLLLALLPLYAWLKGKPGKAAAVLYPDTTLLAGLGRPVREQAGRLRLFLRLLTATALVIAIAGPRTANKEIERETEGLDIMLVVDLSWSMMALDMSTPRAEVTRWQASQNVIYDFLAKRPEDRVGAVVFSGKPYLLSPLTINKIWVEKGVDRMHIGIIQETGTAIGEALALAVDRMKNTKGKNSRVIILLTDGDDNMSKAILPIPAAELAAALGIRLYCVGLGKDEATILPRFDTRTGQLYRDVLGKTIPMQTINPANYVMLEKMAKLANGRFYRALDQQQLGRVYEEINRLERTEVRIRESVTFDSYRLYWVGLAGLLLLTELLLAIARPRAP
jgi:Ca-activated chloride channel family protein